MFTGLVTDVGKVVSINDSGDLKKFEISTSYNLNDILLGASICCNGCCLTVVDKDEVKNSLFFELSPETIEKTNYSDIKKDSLVNLEKSLTLSTELGGHLVTGHVDFVGKVSSIEIIDSEYGENWLIEFAINSDFAKFIAPKGSICVNGVSLTVNEAEDENFRVNIIPHTLKNTNLGKLFKNDKVNIEIDLVARYLDNLLKKRN
jgi:riboflavin synthase